MEYNAIGPDAGYVLPAAILALAGVAGVVVVRVLGWLRALIERRRLERAGLLVLGMGLLRQARQERGR
jgi:hypothetical protein